MRLLHVTSGNLFGGVESFLTALAGPDGAPELEHHFALCFEGRLSDALRRCGATVHSLGGVRFSRPWTVWGGRRRLKGILARTRFDAVVCHGCWPHAVFAPASRACGLPLVFWCHDVPTGRHWLERWARRTPPDLVLANSRWTRDAVPNLFPDAPAETLYLPVPAPALTCRGEVRRRIRAALDTPEEAVVVVQTSRLERWKGHALLLQALARLAPVPGWVCWIAGGAQRPHEAEYLAELRGAAVRDGIADRVRYLGHRSDVPELLSAADVHCQPNTGPEPFGVAFIEALHAGLPVVSTALGGALEIVHDGCGVLVPPGRADLLASALGGLIRDGGLRRRLGAAGPARARELCDPAAQLGRLRDLMAAVVAQECVA